MPCHSPLQLAEEYLAKARGAWVERWNKEIYEAVKYQK